MHWACEKITASAAIPDTVLLEGLLDKVCYLQSYSENSRYLIGLPGRYIFSCICSSLLYKFFLLQLRLCKGISYAAVAAHADNSGRRKLAAMLVDHESQSSKQASFLFG
jgi:hypothetical protein